MNIHLIFWGIFIVLFISILLLDLVVTHRRKEEIRLSGALTWSAIWVIIALLFGGAIYLFFPDGNTRAFEFITGYLIEYSLSVDNLFVFILIFSVMGIKSIHQPRILLWGILGAVVFRILFILLGIELIHRFHYMIYVMGLILIITAFKMLISKQQKIDPGKNLLVRGIKLLFPISTSDNTGKFIIKKDKKTFITLSFVTLILVESTDIIFAIDSIPAILAITDDSFVAITSNLFAIIGLRSLYFALSGILNIFKYLKYGIAIILLFVGMKMLLSGWIEVSVETSLGVVIGLIIVSIIVSLLDRRR